MKDEDISLAKMVSENMSSPKTPDKFIIFLTKRKPISTLEYISCNFLGETALNILCSKFTVNAVNL